MSSIFQNLAKQFVRRYLARGMARASIGAACLALAIPGLIHAQTINGQPPIPQVRLGIFSGLEGAGTPGVVVTSTPNAGDLLFAFDFKHGDVSDFGRKLVARDEVESDGVLLPTQLLINPREYNAVVVRLLDKITTRLETRTVAIGDEIKFGTLTMSVDACLKNPTTEFPESTAFIKIMDRVNTADAKTKFSGWMFASSPALNALDHAIYDIWVIDCKNVEGAALG